MKTLLPEVLDRAKTYAAADPTMLVELYGAEDQRCIWASTSHAAILGYDPEELVGTHWKEIVDEADHAHKTIMLDDAILTGNSLVIGFRIIAKSGKRLCVKVIDTLVSDHETGEQYVICRTTHIGPPIA
jgi:PAS domain S-box-containing protein